MRITTDIQNTNDVSKADPETNSKDDPETTSKDNTETTSKDNTETTSKGNTETTCKDNTEITIWLKKNYAGECVDVFYGMGFYRFKDLTEEDLAALKKDVKPGICNSLARLVKQKTQDRGLLEAPKLPDVGTALDLSQPEYKSTEGENVRFEIPTMLQVQGDGGRVIAPGDLKEEEWMAIARNSCMLYGRRMDGPEPFVAAYPVLHWKVTGKTNFFRSEHLSAEVKSELTFTETSTNYVRQGFTKVTATASTPFCSASVDHESSEKQASASKVKQLYMTGIWDFPRARMMLEECTVVSPQFVSEIAVALGLDANLERLGELIKNKTEEYGLNTSVPNDQQKENVKAALVEVEKVLLRYGHVVGWNVEIGGRLFFVHHKQETNYTNTQEYKDVTSAAVGIKTSSVGGEAGVARGEQGSSSVEAHQIAETSTFTALGGDAILASNPQEWAKTVRDPNLWTVIGMPEVKSTISLLPEPLPTFLHQLWHLYGRQGVLDGKTVRVRCHVLGTVNYLVYESDGKNKNVVRLEKEYYRYTNDEYTKFIMQCYRDDLYYIKHERTGKYIGWDGEKLVTGTQVPSLSGFDDAKPDGALWRIRPADPEGLRGDQYRNAYYLEILRYEALFTNLLNYVKVSDIKGKGGYVPEDLVVWELETVEDW